MLRDRVLGVVGVLLAAYQLSELFLHREKPIIRGLAKDVPPRIWGGIMTLMSLAVIAASIGLLASAETLKTAGLAAAGGLLLILFAAEALYWVGSQPAPDDDDGVPPLASRRRRGRPS
jgi:hypothetical protein